VWETTYLHALTGEDPVLGWVRGSALRPVLTTLDEQDAAALTEEYATGLGAAYPRRPDGATAVPYRRVFAVGSRH
jgi:trans-aconitate 2-methyltransferase